METKQLIEFEVSERISIKKFVEGIGFDFVKGNAFYQLTKKETIQDYKNIVAKRKSDGCTITGTVYTLGHTPLKNNIKYKQQEPSPISLVRATIIFSYSFLSVIGLSR